MNDANQLKFFAMEESYLELPLGCIFKLNGRNVKVVSDSKDYPVSCRGCMLDFNEGLCKMQLCTSGSRKDKTYIHYEFDE